MRDDVCSNLITFQIRAEPLQKTHAPPPVIILFICSPPPPTFNVAALQFRVWGLGFGVLVLRVEVWGLEIWDWVWAEYLS